MGPLAKFTKLFVGHGPERLPLMTLDVVATDTRITRLADKELPLPQLLAVRINLFACGLARIVAAVGALHKWLRYGVRPRLNAGAQHIIAL